MKLMKKFCGLVAALFMGCGMASSQTDEVVKELNDRGYWTPYVFWLQDDDKMETYLNSLDEKCADHLKGTLNAIEDDHERAQALLNARKEIGSSSRRLAKYFNDVDVAKRAFDVAEKADRRYERMKKAINEQLEHMKPAVMPGGPLLYFSYSSMNGFAAYKMEITLDGREGKHQVLVKNETMIRYLDQEEPEEAQPKEVADSVFQRVRDMVEEGQLYDVSRNYLPDYDVMDADNWGMEIVCEQGRVSTSGYAGGPDHYKTLHAILDYLKAIYNGDDKPKE